MEQNTFLKESRINLINLLVCWVSLIQGSVLYHSDFSTGIKAFLYTSLSILVPTILFVIKLDGFYLRYIIGFCATLELGLTFYFQNGEKDNLFYFFIIIVYSALYFDKWFTLMAFLSSNILLTSFYIFDSNRFFSDFTTVEIINLNFVIAATGIIMMVQSGLGKKMILKAREGEAQALEVSNKLQHAMDNITKTADVLDNSAIRLNEDTGVTKKEIDQISCSLGQMSIALEEQAADAFDIVSSLSSIEDTIKELAQYSKDMTESSEMTFKAAEDGKEVMNKLVSQINSVSETVTKSTKVIFELNDQSKEINNIATMIKGVAEQINLLSLNAAIEAARAGEHGKGFAVVAEEVRKLSFQTSNAVKDITEIIENTNGKIISVTEEMNEGKSEVEEGKNIATFTFDNFINISKKVSDIQQKANKVLGGVEKLGQESMSVFKKIESISSIAEELSASSQEISMGTENQTKKIDDIEDHTFELVELSKKLKGNLKDTVN